MAAFGWKIRLPSQSSIHASSRLLNFIPQFVTISWRNFPRCVGEFLHLDARFPSGSHTYFRKIAVAFLFSNPFTFELLQTKRSELHQNRRLCQLKKHVFGGSQQLFEWSTRRNYIQRCENRFLYWFSPMIILRPGNGIIFLRKARRAQSWNVDGSNKKQHIRKRDICNSNKDY